MASKKTSTKKTTESPVENSLLGSILANVKGGDDQKVGKFLERLQRNINRHKEDLDHRITKQGDHLEDALAALETARISVQVSNLTSADNFEREGKRYIDEIASKMEVVESLMESINDLIEEKSRLELIESFCFKMMPASDLIATQEY